MLLPASSWLQEMPTSSWWTWMPFILTGESMSFLTLMFVEVDQIVRHAGASINGEYGRRKAEIVKRLVKSCSQRVLSSIKETVSSRLLSIVSTAALVAKYVQHESDNFHISSPAYPHLARSALTPSSVPIFNTWVPSSFSPPA